MNHDKKNIYIFSDIFLLNKKTNVKIFLLFSTIFLTIFINFKKYTNFKKKINLNYLRLFMFKKIKQ